MIRIQGEQNQSHDPKLKVPAVSSPEARAAAGVKPVDHGVDKPSLPSYLAPIHTRLDTLEVGLKQALETIARLERERNAVTEIVTGALTLVTPESNGNAGGNAVKLTAAEKQRAYRERQKAKRRNG